MYIPIYSCFYYINTHYRKTKQKQKKKKKKKKINK